MNTVADYSIAEIQSTHPFKEMTNGGKLRFCPPSNSSPLAEAALLSVGFKSAMMLAGHSQSVQDQASALGKAVGTLWKVNYDLNRYTNEWRSGDKSLLEIQNRDELKEFLYQTGIEASNLLVMRDGETNLTSSSKDVNETMLELIRYWAIAETAGDRQ